ncbi:MAG: hypothetical protein ACOYOO_12685 [Saprospiraceae bacterium]|jgi:hypothetical protein
MKFTLLIIMLAQSLFAPSAAPDVAYKITQFYGLVFDEGITLHWITAPESISTGYYIERSHDGQTFRRLGYVEAAGYSLLPTRYAFTDSYPFPGMNYYRLSAEEPGGGISDSMSIELYSYNTYTPGIRVFPNPFREEVMVQLPRNISARARLVLVSMQGAILAQMNAPSGQRMALLQLPGLTPGPYLLSLQDGRRTWTAMVSCSN